VDDLPFHPEAEAEYAAACNWYRERSEQAADRFELEVERTLTPIKADPETFPRYDENHQFALVNRFPYSIVYRELSGRLYVVAVAHGSRKPDYWHGRR
jgi:plasmid stabilization system protein ParE